MMKRIRPKLKETALGDWRHAIFKRVVSPPTRPASSSSQYFPGEILQGAHSNGHHHAGHDEGDSQRVRCSASKVLNFEELTIKRSSEEIRELWKNAIKQQILLNRMEKQNHILQAKQEEVGGKRAKLSYTDLGTCDDEAVNTWEAIFREANSRAGYKCDIQLINSAILRGIPKQKRGQVWQLFMQQKRRSNSFKPHSRPMRDVPYSQLRRELTSHQHAILIDLGRTFPAHPFYRHPLGTGQLALFNLLKAYSILDPDVGYCQGLCFVAGILLMHLEEEDAFEVLKYFMFDLGAREHYKSDMVGLQVKLYQLTRMVHDQDPEVQSYLYQQDVLPSLYAAPWFLTMFASQFPLGFSVRVLDFVLLHGVDMITKFAVAIIVDHKSDIVKCIGLEKVMECFRRVVTQIGSDHVNKYLRRVVEMEADMEKQLLTYAIEYSVMHDESFLAFINDAYSPPSSKTIKTRIPAPKSNPGRAPVGCENCLLLQYDIITLLKHIEATQSQTDRDQYPPEVLALTNKYFPNKSKFSQQRNGFNDCDELKRLDDDDVAVQLACSLHSPDTVVKSD